MVGPGRAPIVKSGVKRKPVSQTVGDGEAAGALQLGQNNDHLPVSKRIGFKKAFQNVGSFSITLITEPMSKVVNVALTICSFENSPT